MLINLKKRVHEKELSDNFSIQINLLHKVLKQLALINNLFGTNRVLINGVKKLVSKTNKTRIIDLACGGGDVTYHLHKWARNKNFNIKIVGIDGNKNSIDYANANYANHNLIFKNKTLGEVKINGELIISSNFIYHLTNQELIQFLNLNVPKTEYGIVFNELERSNLAIILFKISLVNKSRAL